MLEQVLNEKCGISSDTSCMFTAYTGYMQSTRLREPCRREGNQGAGSGGEQGARVPQAGIDFDHAKECEACSAFGMTTCLLTCCRQTRRAHRCPSPASLGNTTRKAILSSVGKNPLVRVGGVVAGNPSTMYIQHTAAPVLLHLRAIIP